MKILIIGSKGFIGSHCASYFNTNGHNVWECDVVTDYVNPNYFLVDATNADYSEIFRKHAFDVCINCSGAASVPASISEPQRDFNLNTANVFKLLDAIRNFNPDCKFLNLSSAAVYGNPSHLPVKENEFSKPLSPYGIHKKFAEDICLEFNIHFKIKTCSLRIFSCYGNGLQKQLFWDLFQKATSRPELELFGTGNESRDFIHVIDVVQQIELAINHSDFQADIINSANGAQVFIKDAVKVFANEFGYQGKIIFNNQIRPGDPINWQANISRMQNYGYVQRTNFQSGIKQYIEWLKENK